MLYPNWLDEQIVELHGFKAFQQPDDIAIAIKLIYDKPLWKEISSILGRPEADLKKQLKLIVDRRNKIVHNSDIDPVTTLPGKLSISFSDAQSVLNFIEALCNAIDRIVN